MNSTDKMTDAITGMLPASVSAWIALGGLTLVGTLAVVKVALYARRLCNGQDFVSDCVIGKSTVHIEIDTNGDNKIVASKKLVINMNTRDVQVEDTGVVTPGVHVTAVAREECQPPSSEPSLTDTEKSSTEMPSSTDGMSHSTNPMSVTTTTKCDSVRRKNRPIVA